MYYRSVADQNNFYEGRFSVLDISKLEKEKLNNANFEHAAKYIINEVPPEVTIVFNQILENVIYRGGIKMSFFELLYNSKKNEILKNKAQKEIYLLLELLNLKSKKFEKEIYFLNKIILEMNWR